MGKLIIKDGKFFKDGVEQALEIGNVEQINLLKEINQLTDDLTNEGREVDIDEEEIIVYTLNIKCICGKLSSTEYEKEPYSNDVEEAMVDTKIKCRNCERTYIFKLDKFGDLIYKLLT